MAATVALLAFGAACAPSEHEGAPGDSAVVVTAQVESAPGRFVSPTAASQVGDAAPALREPTLAYLLLTRHFDDAMRTRREEAIARCMAARGFDYVPARFQPITWADPAVGTDPSVSRRFVESWGYGITLRPPEVVDNQAQRRHVEGMATAEREAYVRALVGDPEGSPVGAGGCQLEARQEVFGPTEQQPDMGGLGDIEASIAADPAVLTAEQAWSRCMASQGYAFATRADARASIQDRANAARSPGERDALQREELAQALVDVGCYEQHMATVVATVRRRVEQHYLDDHPQYALQVAEARAAYERAARG